MLPNSFQEEVIVLQETLYFISAGPELIASNVSEEATSVLTLSNLLFLIYSIGLIFTASRMIVGLTRIYKLFKTAKKTKLEQFTLVETEQFHLPFSFLNGVYISNELPLNDDVENILKHELSHVASWHTLDVLFVELLQVIFWFNPLIYLFKKAIKESHEYVADASVLQDTSQKIYGQILLRQSQSGLQIALANHFFHSHIKKRLTMMKQKKSNRPAMLKYLFALPVILLLMVLFQSQTLHVDNEFVPNLIPVENSALLSRISEHVFVKNSGIDLEVKNGTLVYASASGFISTICTTDDMGYTLTLEHDENFKSYYGNLIQLFANQGNVKKGQLIARVADSHGGSNAKLHFEIIKNGDWIDPREYLVRELIVEEVFKDTVPVEMPPFAPPGPPIIDMQQPPGPPPSPDEIWKQVIANDKIETYIDGKRVDIDNAIALKSKLTIQTLGMRDDDNSKINLVKFVTGANRFSNDKIYKEVDQYPRFPGCEELSGTDSDKDKCAKKKMLEFLYSNLKYPVSARIAGIQGSNVIKFVVEPDGSVTALEVVKDIGGETKEATEELLSKMAAMNEKWTPGMKDGKPVRVMFHLPVRFKLDEEHKHTIDISDQYRSGGNDQINNTAINIIAHNSAKVSTEELFKVVEEMPLFPGCDDFEGIHKERENCGKKKMLEFIYDNLEYPVLAEVNGVEGTNVVQFIIEKNGRLSEMNLVRDIGGSTGEATMKVMRKMQAETTWTPGHQRGIPVRVLYTLPIRFKLEDNLIDEDKSVLFKHVSDSPPPLFVVDGVKQSKTFDVNRDLKPNSVVSLRAVSIEDAKHKYGDAGKHGAVEVITKKESIDLELVKDRASQYSKKYSGELFKVVEEMPRFPGCEDASDSQEDKRLCANKKMLEYLYSNLQYPQEARENGIQGVNVVQFVVEVDGSMTDVVLVRDIGGETADATMQVMEDIQKEFTWRPGYQRGVPVRVLYTLPINFKLSDDGSECCEEEDKNGIVVVTDYSLYQYVPNPFGAYTDVSFALPNSGKATIKVFNVAGKVVSTVKDQFNKGFNTVRFTRSELGAASGPFYYQLESGEFKKTMKMIMTK